MTSVVDGALAKIRNLMFTTEELPVISILHKQQAISLNLNFYVLFTCTFRLRNFELRVGFLI